jgi:hypothetical protein
MAQGVVGADEIRIIDCCGRSTKSADIALGADFTYSATVTSDWPQPDLSAHLRSLLAAGLAHARHAGLSAVALRRAITC